jgi:hypothetical protein
MFVMQTYSEHQVTEDPIYFMHIMKSSSIPLLGTKEWTTPHETPALIMVHRAVMSGLHYKRVHFKSCNPSQHLHFTEYRPISFIYVKHSINKINKKNFWEERIAHFLLIRYEPHRKRSVQQFFYCCVCIRCRGTCLPSPSLPTIGGGDTQTDSKVIS